MEGRDWRVDVRARRRGSLGLGDGGQSGFDFGGGEFGRVQQGQGWDGLGAGQNVTEGEAVGFEGLALIGREEVAVPDKEEMGLGGRAEGGAGEGEVGGAPARVPVGGVTRDFGERSDDGLQVAVQDLREQIVHVGEVAADGARGGAHRARELGQADGGGAIGGHEALGAVHDAGAGFLLAIRGGRALAGDVIALGAEDAGWGVHGREDSERRGNAARVCFGGVAVGVRARKKYCR